MIYYFWRYILFIYFYLNDVFTSFSHSVLVRSNFITSNSHFSVLSFWGYAKTNLILKIAYELARFRLNSIEWYRKLGEKCLCIKKMPRNWYVKMCARCSCVKGKSVWFLQINSLNILPIVICSFWWTHKFA